MTLLISEEPIIPVYLAIWIVVGIVLFGIIYKLVSHVSDKKKRKFIRILAFVVIFQPIALPSHVIIVIPTFLLLFFGGEPMGIIMAISWWALGIGLTYFVLHLYGRVKAHH